MCMARSLCLGRAPWGEWQWVYFAGSMCMAHSLCLGRAPWGEWQWVCFACGNACNRPGAAAAPTSCQACNPCYCALSPWVAATGHRLASTNAARLSNSWHCCRVGAHMRGPLVASAAPVPQPGRALPVGALCVPCRYRFWAQYPPEQDDGAGSSSSSSPKPSTGSRRGGLPFSARRRALGERLLCGAVMWVSQSRRPSGRATATAAAAK